MATPVHWGYEFFCEKCQSWHKRSEFKKIDYYASPYYGWTVTYLAPCGAEYVCHGGDPSYNVPPIYLESYFTRKRAVWRDDPNACPACLAVLFQNRERYWNAWQWESGSGMDPHLRVGPPGMGGEPLCQLGS